MTGATGQIPQGTAYEFNSCIDKSMGIRDPSLIEQQMKSIRDMMKNASRSFEELEEDEDYQSEFGGMETPLVQDQSINSCVPVDKKNLKLSKEHYIEDARNF